MNKTKNDTEEKVEDEQYEDEEYEVEENRGRNKFLKIAGITLLLFLILLLILFMLRACDSDIDQSSSSLIYDSNSEEGGWDPADADAIIASLNEKVAEGMINISMNTSPIFKNGSAKGNLMIVNEEINNYPQIVEITRNDTGESIYKSGGIAVGSKIESAKLSVDLPAGEYECTAMFHNVDPDTGESLGSAGAIINIIIQE